MEIYTIGFAQWTARDFFEVLKSAGIRQLIDVRLNNKSQLAGFAKRVDLEYFLKALVGIQYLHLPQLAPTQKLLSDYRKKVIGWDTYEDCFKALLNEREIDRTLDPAIFESRSVLLCSEKTPDKCHRRLVAEHLQAHWQDVAIRHL